MGKTGRTIIRARDTADKPWRDLVVMPFELALFAGEVVNGSLIAGFDPDGRSLLIDSALHSDKGRLVCVDLPSNSSPSISRATRNRGRKSTVRRLTYDEIGVQSGLLLR